MIRKSLGALALVLALGGCDQAQDWWQADAIAEVQALRERLPEQRAEVAHLDEKLAELPARERALAAMPASRKRDDEAEVVKMMQQLRMMRNNLAGEHDRGVARAAELSAGVRAPWRVDAQPLK